MSKIRIALALGALVIGVPAAGNAQTLKIGCTLVAYNGPKLSYDKFNKIDSGVIDIKGKRVDLNSSTLNDGWTFMNGKPGTSSDGDQIAMEASDNRVYGGGTRFGGSYAFDFDRRNGLLIWTNAVARDRAAQTWTFQCSPA